MKDQDIDNFLKDLKAPSPDPQARLRAKRAAVAEFERSHSANKILAFPRQDSTNDARLSREANSHGSSAMNKSANRGWYAAAAGLGVLGVGLMWALPNLDRYNRELARVESPVATRLPEQSSAGAEEAAAVPEAESAAAAAAGTDVADTSASMAAATEPVQAHPAEGERVSKPRIARNSSRAPEADAASQGRAEPQEAQPGLPADAEKMGARQNVDEGLRKEEAAAAEANQRQAEAALASAQAPTPLPAPASAPPPAANDQSESLESVVVTGARQSMKDRREARREAKRDAQREAQRAAGVFAGAVQRVPGMPASQGEGRDRFEHFEINPVHRVAAEPVSTFSADVDTASYSFVRAQINGGSLPEKDAVRAEEMINYFDYAWPAARSRSEPFKPTVVISDSPWGKGKKLVHIGIKGYEVDSGETPPANLVLLLDVSGSMNEPNKLPLVIRSMELLLGSLKPDDTVGIVVYAGAAGTVLEPTPVRERDRILAALHSLSPGGSTAGAEGIERAYQLAEAHFRKGGVNRILLCTDGDFNVGIDSTQALKSFVERKREKGVYLSVLGFGQGNYRDELAQALAQNGNGVAAYIDTESEARKVLVQEASSALFTIAKDVKLQVEFNPATVSEYRLVGYETRALKREDFNNDAVDAGDVGAGHTVTAIYEVTPVGVEGSVDELRYPQNIEREKRAPGSGGSRDEYGFLKIRYKLPGERTSRLISEAIPLRTSAVSPDVKRDVSFSTAVAGFAQLLRGGTYTGALSYGDVIEQAQSARGEDRFGYRAEFIDLVRRAQNMERE